MTQRTMQAPQVQTTEMKVILHNTKWIWLPFTSETHMQHSLFFLVAISEMCPMVQKKSSDQ